MKCVLIVGAGPGVGTAVARQFAHQGYAVGLIARNQDRLEALAGELRRDVGVGVALATADVTRPAELESAIDRVTDDLGAPDALCFSPIPDIGLIKPVLATTAEEFMASLALNIAGAVGTVQRVLPAMRARGTGSLLFTTGSAGLHPDPARAASAVTTTAATVYLALLRQALADTGIRVGHTVVVGPIGPGGHDPVDVAADLWRQHLGPVEAFPSVLRLAEVG